MRSGRKGGGHGDWCGWWGRVKVGEDEEVGRVARKE